MDTMERFKETFPQCEVIAYQYNPYPAANIVSVFAERGRKYLDNGFPNPKYWWHEWCAIINKDETKIDEVEFEDMLAEMKEEVERTLANKE